MQTQKHSGCSLKFSQRRNPLFCSDDQILSLLSSLKTKKATWADGISAQMLKATGTSIVKSITKLFNLSLKTGIFPTDWKFARVVPIPKTGNPESPSNYRPISILPIISKLLEKHVHNLLYHHLNNNCSLSPNQWGFTEGKSTTTALLSFVHECQEALDNGGEVCSVFFDLCKAFDSVPHQPLLCKLFHLQVNPFLLRWIHNYLSSRTQSVVLQPRAGDHVLERDAPPLRRERRRELDLARGAGREVGVPAFGGHRD